MVGTLVMAPKSVTLRRHDHLVSVLFGDLLSHSYNITFSMFLYLVIPMLNIFQHTIDIPRSWQRSCSPFLLSNSIRFPRTDVHPCRLILHICTEYGRRRFLSTHRV